MVYGQLPSEEIATGLGFDLGLVLELGAIFPGDNCLTTL